MTNLAMLMLVSANCTATGAARTEALAIGQPRDRSDRLVSISGKRKAELLAECSADDGKTWQPATIYVGATVDAWRPCDPNAWNAGVIAGRLPAGKTPCLWNYVFDLATPLDCAILRFRSATGSNVVLQKTVDLRDTKSVFVIDHRNVAGLAGGSLPAPWRLQPGPEKRPTVDSFGVTLTKHVIVPGRHPVYRIDQVSAPPLVLEPKLKGWHRVYLGMETYGSLQYWLSGEQIRYPIPEYHTGPKINQPRLMQEFYIHSTDMTGEKISLACGGARYWRDASVRYIRFVPMTHEEVAGFRRSRELARTKGRPFAGYVEPCTPCHYEPASLTLLAHLRNEVRLNKVRGCSDVYVHVIRAGSKAWYHSDVVERYLPKDDLGPDGPAAKWTAWMKQGDPMAMAAAEGRAAGMKVFADMGMNVSYAGDLRERTIAEHLEYLLGRKSIFLDYRKGPVRDYVVAIARELLTKYEVDGIHLDFARFAHNKAYDEASLIDVVERIHKARRQAETQRGRRILIAARIPSYRYHSKNAATYRGEYPEFLAALRTWAQSGWIDRVMACSMGYVRHVRTLSIERYASAIAGTNVRLWGDLYGGGAFVGTPRSAWLAVARSWVSQGLDGGFFFYAIDRPTEFEAINWQLRLIDFPQVAVEPVDR